MMHEVSPNTQAILLLTAPLLTRGGGASLKPLSLGEYKRLARRLVEINQRPCDLVGSDAQVVLDKCHQVVDGSRLQSLLSRGFLLSQALERWQARSIWVVSRADDWYPRRLKKQLRDDSPPILYGCGPIELLDSGGLAIVGSRHVDHALIDYTEAVGDLAARARRSVISGGAKGIDRAAMRGALEGGGRVCGVLADSLEKAAMNRENRDPLIDGQLALVSPYDPSARFHVGSAMGRNKLIYALAEASLVVSSDLKKGGTWTGASEQLKKYKFGPIYVRSTDEPSPGLAGLRNMGARPWPEPHDVSAFKDVLSEAKKWCARQKDGGLFSRNAPSLDLANPVTSDPTPPHQNNSVASKQTRLAYESGSSITSSDRPATAASEHLETQDDSRESEHSTATPAEDLIATVRSLIQQVVKEPKNRDEVAKELRVKRGQATAWLDQLVKEGILEKGTKPAKYSLSNSFIK